MPAVLERKKIKGVVTEIEDNPFVGFVISVKTKDLGMFFDKEYLFKKLN